MTQKNRLDFLITTVYFALVALLVVFALRYLVQWLLPLVLGLAIAFVLHPVVNAVYRHSSATRRFCAVAVLLAAYAALGALLWLGLIRLVGALEELLISLPDFYATSVVPAAEQLNVQVSTLLEQFFPQFGAQYTSFTQLLSQQAASAVSGLSSQLIGKMSNVFSAVPTLMLTFLFTVLSSFFISMDYNTVMSFLARLVPRRHRKLLFELKDFLVQAVLRFARAYLILLFITFVECWAGLALLRVHGAVWWALLIALADLLPAVGTGLILIPWGVLALLQGESFLGFGLFALWGVICLVRNLIEPKVVGDNIGLHPLVTITAMFFGLKLLGVPGMLMAPVAALLIKFLHESGRIKLWDPPAHPDKSAP